MDQLVYPRERALSALLLAIGLVLWLVIVVGTVGIALGILLAGFVIYLFAQSAIIAWIKGNGVELNARQFPDLHAQFVQCCERLGMKEQPKAYVLNGNGAINAFATRFLGHQYVVLMSDTVDAMQDHPDGARFYIGHELGHLRMNHMPKQLLRWPALWLPLLGAAYARAKECTADRHGRECSSSPESAALALGALASGRQQWRTLDVAALRDQAGHSRGFWMSFHELCGGYPWLTKRVVRVSGGEQDVPGRHPMAYIPAAIVPYAGRLGGGFGLVILVYIIGVLAAIALPAYQTYTTKAKVSSALTLTGPTLQALADYYKSHQHVPKSLAEAGVTERLSDGTTLSLDPQDMSLTLGTAKGPLLLTPQVNEQGRIVRWNCAHGSPLKTSEVPRDCAAEMP